MPEMALASSYQVFHWSLEEASAALTASVSASLPFWSRTTLPVYFSSTTNLKPDMAMSGLLAMMASPLPLATAMQSKSPFFSCSTPVPRSVKRVSSLSGSCSVARDCCREAFCAPILAPFRPSAVANLSPLEARVIRTCSSSLSPAW